MCVSAHTYEMKSKSKVLSSLLRFLYVAILLCCRLLASGNRVLSSGTVLKVKVKVVVREYVYSTNMTSSVASNLSRLITYTPPTWAAHLKIIPKFKIQLANPDTPIHEWNLPGLPDDCSVSIKRDDMTGSTLSGNKVRKLEFLLADAIQQGCKHVITCGGIQSNHCRATAVAARQLGLQTHLFLRTDITDTSSVDCEGNLLLNRMCGAKMYLVPRFFPFETKLKPCMEQLAASIKAKTSEESYLIPVGGSNEIGLFGYITVFQEMINQGLHEKFTDIVFACGSGGTTAGISIANHLTGGKLKCHAVIVCDNEDYFHQHVNDTLDSIGLTVRSPDILDIIDGYKGKGYGISTQEELDFILEVGYNTGIMLDPVYSGKAARGMIQEIQSHPERFQGRDILFIHTGGVFGTYDGTINSSLKESEGNQVQLWSFDETV